jgi:hypothetical protein
VTAFTRQLSHNSIDSFYNKFILIEIMLKFIHQYKFFYLVATNEQKT